MTYADNAPRLLLGVADFARHYGTTSRAVNQWLTRSRKGIYRPFPVPNVELPTPNFAIPGWEPSRLYEVDEWKVNHANPDDPPLNTSVLTRRLLSVTSLSKHFEVSSKAVFWWLSQSRQGKCSPFPQHDVEIRSARKSTDQVFIGWEPERMPEIEQWRAQQPGRGWRAGQLGETRYRNVQRTE